MFDHRFDSFIHEYKLRFRIFFSHHFLIILINFLFLEFRVTQLHIRYYTILYSYTHNIGRDIEQKDR